MEVVQESIVRQTTVKILFRQRTPQVETLETFRFTSKPFGCEPIMQDCRMFLIEFIDIDTLTWYKYDAYVHLKSLHVHFDTPSKLKSYSN